MSVLSVLLGSSLHRIKAMILLLKRKYRLSNSWPIPKALNIEWHVIHKHAPSANELIHDYSSHEYLLAQFSWCTNKLSAILVSTQLIMEVLACVCVIWTCITRSALVRSDAQLHWELLRKLSTVFKSPWWTDSNSCCFVFSGWLDLLRRNIALSCGFGR